MKNIFIATLGTREIQFIKDEVNNHADFIISSTAKGKSIKIRNIEDSDIHINENTAYPEYFCHSFPRLAGETILKYFENFKGILHFPLIANAINNILENYKIDRIILVYTDQKDLDLKDSKQINNFNRDTINYKGIIEKVLVEKFPHLQNAIINDIAIEERVADIDSQYNFFGKKLKEILPADDIDNLFLLPQGGIDQINHALTLQLIQNFGKKVHLWQQSESPMAQELQFTHLFLDDLLKNKISSLIDNLEYKGAYALAHDLKQPDQKLIKFLNFAYLRKDLLFVEAQKIFNGKKNEIPDIIQSYQQEELFCDQFTLNCFSEEPKIKSYLFRSTERLFLSDFYFKIKEYSRFTLSFSVFLENIIGTYITSVSGLNLDLVKKYDWDGRKLIESLKKSNPDVIQWIIDTINLKKQSKINDIILSFPTLILIARFYAHKNGHQPIKDIIDFLFHVNGAFNNTKPDNRNFENLRNDIAHNGKGVEEKDLIGATDTEKSIKWWEANLTIIKKHFMVGTNPYIEINSSIKAIL